MAQHESEKQKHHRWIREFLTPKLIQTGQLFTCESTDNVEVNSIEINELPPGLAFMISFCYFVKISIAIQPNIQSSNESDNYTNKKEVDFVVKIAPQVSPDRYKTYGLHESYATEIAAYEHIIPRVKCLSKSPKYYYSHNKFLDSAIVLSNFTKDGWQMSKLQVNLPLDHILVAVKCIGEFHGNMYALKLSDIDTFNCIRDKLKFPRYKVTLDRFAEWRLWSDLGVRRATNSVRASKIASHIVPESFLKQLEDIMFESYDYRMKRYEPIEPFAIICHGDCLRSNIAFRYDADGKPIESMMYDFQTMCYTSPMIDLTVFMALSTGYEVRNKHFTDIFAAYHESLVSSFLAITKWKDSDVPEFLSCTSLLKEYARYLPFGLSSAAAFLAGLHVTLPACIELDMLKLISNALDEGGEIVDKELTSLIVDIYRLHDKFNLSLEKI